MSWRLYNLTIVDNPEAATGSVEELTLAVKANETLDTWNMTALHIPARFLDYGRYKAVFKLEVRVISLPPPVKKKKSFRRLRRSSTRSTCSPKPSPTSK